MLLCGYSFNTKLNTKVTYSTARGTTVGYKRILRIPETSAGKVRITVTGAKAVPVLSEAGLYLDD